MHSTRAFHLFTHFSIHAAALLVLAAVAVLLATGCVGEEPASPGTDATPQSTEGSRPQEGGSGTRSASANTPEATEEADRPAGSSGESGIKSGGEIISAGDSHTCRVGEDGSVECWGWNELGQAGPPAGEFASVSAGAFHTCGVKTDGSVACWGTGHYGQTTAPRGEFTSVSSGAYHTCGVKTNGSVACWGGTNSNYGQAQPPEGEFSSVSGAISHTCGVKTNGSVAC